GRAAGIDLDERRRFRAGPVAKHQTRGADQHLVAILQPGRRGDALPIDERAVRRPEIAHHVFMAVPVDAAVLARHFRITQAHRRLRRASDDLRIAQQELPRSCRAEQHEPRRGDTKSAAARGRLVARRYALAGGGAAAIRTAEGTAAALRQEIAVADGTSWHLARA